MTIKDIDWFLSNIWDWSILSGCFGDTKIEPTDIDGFVERNGKFLILETKSIGGTIKKGQEITFKKMVKTGLFTVIVVWGEVNHPRYMKVYSSEKETDKKEATLDDLRKVVKWWFNNMT